MSGFFGISQSQLETICEKVAASESILSLHLSDFDLYSLNSRALMSRLQNLFGFELQEKIENENTVAQTAKYLKNSKVIKAVCSGLAN